MELHDRIKSFLIERLCEEVSEVAFTTELRLGGRRLDVANRNLKWIVEVEPTQREKESGKRQLMNYVSLIESQGIQNVCAILCHHRNAKTTQDPFGRSPSELVFYVLENGALREIDWDTFLDLARKSTQDKLPVEGRIFVGLFRSSKEEFYLKLREIFERYLDYILPLYEVYKFELRKIYSDATEEKAKELYVLHSILNAIAVCLVNTIIFPHAGIERRFQHKKGFSLPFLNWWLVLYRQEVLSQDDRKRVLEFMQGIAAVIDSFDWSKGKSKDIFRLLYEEYVSEEDRRKIGEYYTPTWFVKWCLDQNSQWRDLKVLDPCCGTGTFLDEVLRRKIKSGKSPDQALSEVIGFDINPLAVVLARAELFLTYRLEGGKSELIVPLVFYGDSSLWLRERQELLRKIGDRKEEYVRTVHLLSRNRIPFDRLHAVENALEGLFEKVEEEIKGLEQQQKKLQASELIKSGLKEIFKNEGEVERVFNVDRMAEEIASFGDGIWAVVVVSSIAQHTVEGSLARECFIATNPPWINFSRIEGAYGQVIRKIVKGYGATGQEITGGDVASLFLCRYGSQAQAGVFVMPQPAVYSGSYGRGAEITLRCLTNKPHSIYLFEYDVFKHGISPAVAVIGQGQGEIYKIRLKKTYQKAEENYDAGDFEITPVSREAYEIAKSAFSEENYGIERVANKVKVKGTYIMGLKGGEKKRGAERYAGLIVEEYNQMTGEGRLINMEGEVFLDIDFRERWIRKVIYADRVLPFKLLEPYDTVIAEDGEKGLKEFLTKLLKKVENEEDRKRLSGLIKEVKQGKPEYLSKDRFYLLHRVVRIFSSVVFTPSQDGLYIPDSTVCFVEFSEELPAYYYCGLINYLVEKTQKGYHRNIHSRVLRALDFLGVHWQGLDWQGQCAELSMVLHDKMREINVNNNKSALEALRQMQEYWSLIKLIDEHVDKDGLERAVKLLGEEEKEKKNNENNDYFIHFLT